jgi:NCAIR mutase (PurE)-related protein
MPVNEAALRELLQRYRRGRLGLDSVLKALKSLPYEDIGFAKIDTHRSLRKGFPEVIFGPGKTPEQVVKICRSMAPIHKEILITRASEDVYSALKTEFPEARFHPDSRAVTIAGEVKVVGRGTILVLTGGTSDIPVADEAAVTAWIMGNRVERLFDVGVAGIHRLLNHKEALFSASVIIAVAGMEGALPSVVGGMVDAPIIAVPTSIGYGSHFGGISALLSMLNSCAPGVAVVNIDNGFGAGYIASVINRVWERGSGVGKKEAGNKEDKTDRTVSKKRQLKRRFTRKK